MLSTKKKYLRFKKKKENTLSIKEKWNYTRERPIKKVGNQDLDHAIDREKKQVLSSHFFSFINYHLRWDFICCKIKDFVSYLV